jgi:hypothetical protein
MGAGSYLGREMLSRFCGCEEGSVARVGSTTLLACALTEKQVLVRGCGLGLVLAQPSLPGAHYGLSAVGYLQLGEDV